MDYQGKCFRHVLRFQPSPQFNNNCPACYWEGEAGKTAAQLERALDGAKASVKDGPIYIQNIGGGTFVEIDPPRK